MRKLEILASICKLIGCSGMSPAMCPVVSTVRY